MLIDRRAHPQALAEAVPPEARIEIGILTKGKPTLGMVLASLLLQEAVQVRIHVVDTSLRPVINRDDVRFALRLAADRGVSCSYDFAGESERAFSAGKARLLAELTGPHLCLVDDDIVMPSDALARLLERAHRSGVYGYISPICVNAPRPATQWSRRVACTPGSLLYQDALVHRIMLDYYESTVDVLDRLKTEDKVWETAFLTTLFEALDRPAIRETDTSIYHLDYDDGPRWIDDEAAVIGRSARTARELVKLAAANRLPRPKRFAPLASLPHPARSSWFSRARRVLRPRR